MVTEEFNTSLVREKITFIDDSGVEVVADNAPGPTVIRSNRIFLKLAFKGKTEKVVVRAQNMHTTLRLAAKILYNFHRNGPLLNRSEAIDWDALWEAVLSVYEKEYNPNIWAAVYINGQNSFKTTTAPFVDVVEKCALLTIDNYDATMEVTESALKQIGKAMRITHSSNVAAVFTDSGDTMRCGIIHRAEGRDTTFSYTATGGDTRNRVVQSLNMTAAFLEALNLRYLLRSINIKLRKGEIRKASPEASQARVATGQQVALHKLVTTFEEMYDVKYRPEKPEFFGNF